MCSSGQALTVACAMPGRPCSTPGPDTVNSAAGVPVRKPAAAAAYPAACSLRKLMKRMPAACNGKRKLFKIDKIWEIQEACHGRRLLAAEAQEIQEADARRLRCQSMLEWRCSGGDSAGLSMGCWPQHVLCIPGMVDTTGPAVHLATEARSAVHVVHEDSHSHLRYARSVPRKTCTTPHLGCGGELRHLEDAHRTAC